MTANIAIIERLLIDADGLIDDELKKTYGLESAVNLKFISVWVKEAIKSITKITYEKPPIEVIKTVDNLIQEFYEEEKKENEKGLITNEWFFNQLEKAFELQLEFQENNSYIKYYEWLWKEFKRNCEHSWL
jgi:hypothetical protein